MQFLLGLSACYCCLYRQPHFLLTEIQCSFSNSFASHLSAFLPHGALCYLAFTLTFQSQPWTEFREERLKCHHFLISFSIASVVEFSLSWCCFLFSILGISAIWPECACGKFQGDFPNRHNPL